MPNWCNNSISLVSGDEKQLRKIRNMIKKGMKKPKLVTGWTDAYFFNKDGSLNKKFTVDDLIDFKDFKHKTITNIEKFAAHLDDEKSQFVLLITFEDGKSKFFETKVFPANTSFTITDDSLINMILVLSGLNTFDINVVPDEYNARGYINDIGDIHSTFDDRYYFQLDIDSAWSPCLVIDWAIKTNKKLDYDNIQVLIRAEEPGCEIYYNNDTEGLIYPESYCLDSDYEELDAIKRYYLDEASLVEAVKEAFLGTNYEEKTKDAETIQDLEDILSSDDDHFFCVHSF